MRVLCFLDSEKTAVLSSGEVVREVYNKGKNRITKSLWEIGSYN